MISQSMLSDSKISTSYLLDRYDTANFLDSRRRFTRALGKAGAQETGFVEGDNDPNRKPSSFRGINFLNPSPFGTRPLQDFRGVDKGKFDGLANPDVHLNNSALDNRYQVEPQKMDFLRHNPLEAENIDYGEELDWAYIRQHPEIADMLAVDETLREGFFDERLDSDFDLKSQIIDLAHQKLGYSDVLNEDELAEQFDTAKLAALNIGETADILNSDAELREAVTNDPSGGYSNDIRDEFAAKIAGMFSKETGLDQQFFRDSPEAGIFLKKRPGLVDRLSQRPDDAEDFKRYFGQFRGQVREEALESSQSALSGRGLFIEDYLRDNPEFAIDAAVDSSLKTGDSLTDNTILHDELQDKTAFVNDVYEGHISARAEDSLGEGHIFDREFFKSNSRLAFGVQRSKVWSEGLKNASAEAEKFFSEPAGEADLRSNIRGAMLAFSGGYPLRSVNLIDFWV